VWALYYYGLAADGHARDLLALGRDPLHFTKVPQIMVDVGPSGSIDEDYAHKPSLIFSHGALYHFYCCVSGKWPHDTRAITAARSRPWTEKVSFRQSSKSAQTTKEEGSAECLLARS